MIVVLPYQGEALLHMVACKGACLYDLLFWRRSLPACRTSGAAFGNQSPLLLSRTSATRVYCRERFLARSLFEARLCDVVSVSYQSGLLSGTPEPESPVWTEMFLPLRLGGEIDVPPFCSICPIEVHVSSKDPRFYFIQNRWAVFLCRTPNTEARYH